MAGTMEAAFPTEIEIEVARLLSDVLFAVDEEEDELCVDNAFVAKLVVGESSFRASIVFPVVVEGGLDGMISVEYPTDSWVPGDERSGGRFPDREERVDTMVNDIRAILRQSGDNW